MTTPKSDFEREPREFWIKEGMPDIVLPIEEYERQKRERLHMTGIHVIEYSAYAAAQKEIERLTRDRDTYRDGFTEADKLCMQWSKKEDEWRAKNVQLRALLKECEQELEYYSGQTRASDLLQKLKRLRGE